MGRRPAIEYLRTPLAQSRGADTGASGLFAVEVVAVLGDADGEEREALAQALQRIAAGEASVLLVQRLSDVARSARELLAIVDWLAAANAELVALDVALDTGAASGALVVRVLRELEHGPRAGPAAARPRGRPGIAARAPDLGERIAALRESGLSLQAIADALTAQGVPTPRGGARWRPSSVQAALGYRRPRPPAPGLPPRPPAPRDPPAPAAPPHGPRARPAQPRRAGPSRGPAPGP